MKKSLLILMAALLSMGTMMAQSAKQTTRLQATSLTEQVKAPAMQQSMAKDVLCDWYSNMDASDSPTSAIGGFYGAYGIANYAEKITNSQVLTIDSIGYMVYEIDDNPGSITLAIYDEATTGGPGTSLGSVTVSNWSDFTYEAVALTTPVQVTGNYYIVCTVSDDATAMLATANRTQTTSTAYIQFNGTWQPIYQVLNNSQTSQPFYGSFFLYAYACTADLQGSYTITATANNSAWGTVTGGGTYNAGTTCTLTATPAEGYRFICWQDSVTTNPRSFPVLADATYQALFAVEPNCTHTLPYFCSFETEDEVYCWNSVDVDNDGYGWMPMSNWGGADGADGTSLGSASYMNGVGVLTPDNWVLGPELNIPAGGATLTWWVSATDANDYAEQYDVKLAPNAGTAITDYTVQLFTETLTDNQWHQRTAQITNEGIVRIAFRHHDCTNMYWLLIDSISVVANTPTESYTITVNVDNPAHGSATGSGTYYAGQQVTISATPASGYAFLQWNDGNMQNPRTITVTGDATYTATFAQDDTPEYTITLLAAWVRETDTLFLIEEEADFSGAGTYSEGSHATLSVQPKAEVLGEQLYFNGWQDGNTQMPRTVTVTEDKTYTAYFFGHVGIDGVENGAEVLRTEYYDVLGRQLATEPAHGIFLIRTITTQGQSTKKVMKL